MAQPGRENMAVPKRTQGSMTHAVESATLADVLERILDKGLVVAGDIKIKLVDIELLTIQIRLLVCSVEKAREMGIDWWTTNSYLSSNAAPQKSQVEDLSARMARLEDRKSTRLNSSHGSISYAAF